MSKNTKEIEDKSTILIIDSITNLTIIFKYINLNLLSIYTKEFHLDTAIKFCNHCFLRKSLKDSIIDFS